MVAHFTITELYIALGAMGATAFLGGCFIFGLAAIRELLPWRDDNDGGD